MLSVSLLLRDVLKPNIVRLEIGRLLWQNYKKSFFEVEITIKMTDDINSVYGYGFQAQTQSVDYAPWYNYSSVQNG